MNNENQIISMLERFDKRFDKRFDNIDEKFESIDKRFESIDRKFESIDKRFDSIDMKFENIDMRFESIDMKFESIDQKFESIDQKLESHSAQLTEHSQILKALLSGQEYLKAELDGFKISTNKEFKNINDKVDTISINYEILRNDTHTSKVDIQRIKNTMGMA